MPDPTVSRSTADLQTYNPNYIGGDIMGGANDWLPATQVNQQPNRRDRPQFATHSRSY
jgi:hypothetical protein